MSTEKTKVHVPALRFPGFEMNWSHSPLSTWLESSRDKNSEGQFGRDEVLSVSRECGVVNQIEHLGRSYAGASLLPYSILLLDMVVYTKSPLKEAPFGIVKSNRYADGIVSTLYACYKPKAHVSSVFVDYYFSDALRLNRYFKPIVNIGAKNDMKINNDFALSNNVVFPELDEQKKIAEFLTSVDERIAKLKRKKELMEEYKRGMMQKLFSQEIRFKDEDGNDFPDWEMNRMEELFDRVTRKNSVGDDNVLTISGQYGLVSQVEYFNKSVASKDTTGYTRLLRGEFAYNKSYSKGYPFGAIKTLDRYSSGVVSPLYICFKPKNRGSIGYFKHLFEAGYANRGIHRIAQEGARNHGLLNVSVVEFFHDIQLPVPSLEEQHKITALLSDLESRVHTLLNQIENAQEFKRGLLQKMFV